MIDHHFLTAQREAVFLATTAGKDTHKIIALIEEISFLYHRRRCRKKSTRKIRGGGGQKGGSNVVNNKYAG